MRKALFCVLLFTLVPAGMAVAADELKVTGGGQVIAEMQTTGPGDTIAFNAQQDDDTATMNGTFDAKGQLQVINRFAGGERFHGEVTCIRDLGMVNPGDENRTVRFGGFQRTRDGSTVPFVVDVMDNGEGQTGGNDMIVFRRRAANEEDPCDDTDEDTELRDTRLARGNVQDH